MASLSVAKRFVGRSPLCDYSHFICPHIIPFWVSFYAEKQLSEKSGSLENLCYSHYLRHFRYPTEPVEWSKNPRHGQRLLDWLDENRNERKILFSLEPRPHGRLNKVQCGRRAAAVLFSEDVDLKGAYAANPKYYSTIIVDHIRRWYVAPSSTLGLICNHGHTLLVARRYKYRHFNNNIGAEAARMKYRDLKGPLLDKISKCLKFSKVHAHKTSLCLDTAMLKFPEWSRLHFYWRTNPLYNKFWTGKEPSKGKSSGSKAPMQSATQLRLSVKKTLPVAPTRPIVLPNHAVTVSHCI